MVQLAPQHSGSPFGHNSYVPHQTYAYDVSHKTGRVTSTVLLMDIDGTIGIRKGQSIVCPVYTGACVSSVTGGVVEGNDMYGQFIRETVGAAGTGAIAFATITKAPADAKWANKFGLPYKYASGSMAGYTITPPDEDGDARGLIAQTAAITDPVEVVLDYIADQTNLMGDPYKTRAGTQEVGSATLTCTATVDSDGVAELTVPASDPVDQKFTATFPDGYTVRGTCGTPVNHTISPIWMSQMRGRIDAAAANRMIAVGFDNTAIKGTYATVTGSIITPFEVEGLQAMGLDYDPESGTALDDDTVTTGADPEQSKPVVSAPPSSFNTHAAADAWLDQFVADTGTARPDDWDGQTLSAKRTQAQELFDTWDAG